MQNCVVHCVCFINAARPCGFRAPRTAAHKYLLHHPAFPPRRRVHLNRGHLSIDPSVDRRERKRERREEKIGAKIDSRNWPRFLSSNRRSTEEPRRDGWNPRPRANHHPPFDPPSLSLQFQFITRICKYVFFDKIAKRRHA